MFKALTVYKVITPDALDHASVSSALQGAVFVPGSAQQEKSVGWTPPRGNEHEAFVEAINGHWLATFRMETRSVPAETLNKQVDAMAAKFEDETGRKPGRKELRSIKEDAMSLLLPHGIVKTVTVPVWIDPVARLVSIGTATQSRLDEVVTALVRSISGLALEEKSQKFKTVGAMREWLMSEDDENLPSGMTLGTECVLRHDGEGKATARFTNQNLACDEVRQNLTNGKDPVSLGLAWGEHAEFVLHASGRLKGIHLSASKGTEGGESCGRDLDADFALLTGTLGPIIEQLCEEIDKVTDRLDRARGASEAAIKGIASMWSADAMPPVAVA